MGEVVRILFLGDPEVGKSSIISTYTSRHFPDDGVPSIIYDSKLPPDSTANGTFVIIMDSNSKSSSVGNAIENRNNSSLVDKICSAHSIVCVYDVTRPETLESISSEWLPLIKEAISHSNAAIIPSVVIVGNKTDLLNEVRDDSTTENDYDIRYFTSLLTEYPFVKYCCRCSAKLIDVDNVFYYAENVVTFPIDPIYDVSISEFTTSAVGAFKRIFRLFDVDGDGLLNDTEIAALQYRCFHIEFAHDEIIALKKHIIQDVPGGLSRNNKITFRGFVGMMKKFIEKRSNLETAWIILRNCGYKNKNELILEVCIHIYVYMYISLYVYMCLCICIYVCIYIVTC